MLIRLIDFFTPLLHFLPPEVSHKIALLSLKLLNALGWKGVPNNQEPLDVLNIRFGNRLGLAAGLDKNGDYLKPLSKLGFSFIEVGTVTPRPQPGNPKPRLFRFSQDQVLINQMGFNNKGVDHLVEKLKKVTLDCKLGISIGKNFDTPNENALEDYLNCLIKIYRYADYVAINISSPNTKNLRELQSEDHLEILLNGLTEQRVKLEKDFGYKPFLVKVSPNLTKEQIRLMSQVVKSNGIDGLICTNTSNVHEYKPREAGMSGRNLLTISNDILSQFRELLGRDFPIIASGGVMDRSSYESKILCGADLVQVYTGIIFNGPGLIEKLANKA